MAATVDGNITAWAAETAEGGHHRLLLTFTTQVQDGGPVGDPEEYALTYPVDLLDGRTAAEARDIVVDVGYGGNKPLADFKQEVLDLYNATSVLRGVNFPVPF